jgi:hypothetical protein
MWSRSYSKKVSGVTIEQIWRIWSDINQWHLWQDDIEYAQLLTSFSVGEYFTLKPKNALSVKIELLEIEQYRQFTDLTRFFGAKMYGKHEFIQHENDLEIKTTMSIEGPLSFFWRKIVAEDIVRGLEHQTEKLVEQARNVE